jgi:hypothetical protein
LRALLAESSVVTAQHSKRCWPRITTNSGAALRALLAETLHGTTTNSGAALRALLAETLHGTTTNSSAALRALLVETLHGTSGAALRALLAETLHGTSGAASRALLAETLHGTTTNNGVFQSIASRDTPGDNDRWCWTMSPGQYVKAAFTNVEDNLAKSGR